MDTSPCWALPRSSAPMRSSCSFASPGSGIPKARRSFPSLRSLSCLCSICMNPSHPMHSIIVYSPECVEALLGCPLETPARSVGGGHVASGRVLSNYHGCQMGCHGLKCASGPSRPYSPECVEGKFSEVCQEFMGNSSPLASVAESAELGGADQPAL